MKKKINYKYTYGYIITIAFCNFNLGLCNVYFNTVTEIMHAQFTYHNKFVIKDKDLFNSIMSSLIPVGGIFGATIGGFLAIYGRRKTMIYTTICFLVATLMTTILNFFTLFIGRLLIGVCIGVYITLAPIMVREISPKSLFARL